MKTYFRSLLYLGVFAFLSTFLYNKVLYAILYTVCHAILGEHYMIPYLILTLLTLSAIMIFSWRLFSNREMGEEKRIYLQSILGKEYDHKETVRARRKDSHYRAILLAALTVSIFQSVFVGAPVLFPFQFGLFWLTESLIYVKRRKKWAEERMRKE